MKTKHRPTLRAIADHLGVHVATVSRALRGDGRISEGQRSKIKKAADKLGYKRDPKLAELMTHLRSSKQRSFQGNLAWITNLDPADPDMKAMIDQFLPHAEKRAAALGYKLDSFFQVKPADAPSLARIFHARSIHGVWASIFWQVDYDEWKWDWRKFAFIHHGAEPKRRIVDVVDAEDRQNIQHLYECLAARGYQRIGVATTHHLEREALFELTAGRVRFSMQNPAQPAFEPCLVDALDAAGAAKIAKWIKKHRVDCIVSRWRGMTGLLASIGYRVPQDIGLAYVTVRPSGGTQHHASGIDINAPLIALTAIDTLISAVEHRRCGLPKTPRQTLVPGRWHQGDTCRY
jgi:DNA-binding LacI/PurR family transcriptional regulator